jgi:hypothetical protein
VGLPQRGPPRIIVVAQTTTLAAITMVLEISVLVLLVQLVDRLPTPVPPVRRGRGRPATYPDRLFLKALVIMIVKHLPTPYELFTVLEQPTAEMTTLRHLGTIQGHYPSRRTFERRLAALPEQLPAQIRCLGCQLVAQLQPWATCGRAVAADSTEVPHTSIDTEAHWTKSGWHGWVYGWKLHLLTVVADGWIPLAADLTPANADDSTTAAQLLWWNPGEWPPEMRYLLGDQHYNTPLLRAICQVRDWVLVATRRGAYPHTDDRVEVRRIFHKLRSLAIENFNEHFKSIFAGHAQVPTKGLVATRRWALGAVFVYQLALWYRHEHGLDLNDGLKAFLKAA